MSTGDGCRVYKNGEKGFAEKRVNGGGGGGGGGENRAGNKAGRNGTFSARLSFCYFTSTFPYIVCNALWRQMNAKAPTAYAVLLLCLSIPHAQLTRDEAAPLHQNPCCSMPCKHRGVCTPLSNVYYECSCPSGYYGHDCEKTTLARWVTDKLDFDQAKRQKLASTGRLVWGVINNIPLLHDAALRYLFLSGSDLGGLESRVWHSYYPYASADACCNQSHFRRGLPPVPAECPTPLGVKGPRVLPEVEEVFGQVLQRREFKPCPLGTNVMFVTFAQLLAYQFFKTASLDDGYCYGDRAAEEAARKALRSGVNGKLKARMINGEEYPPYLDDVPQVPMHYPPRSDSRKEEVFPKWAMVHGMLSATPFTFAMATVWLREHNRVCDVIAKHHPGWSDERVYQTARWIILGELVTITAGEYLQHLAQCKLQLKYKPELFHGTTIPTSSQMQHEFGLAFRWHQLLPDHLTIQDTPYNLTQLLYTNNRVVFEHGLDAIVDSMSRHPAGQVTFRNCGKAFESTMKRLIGEGRKTRLHSLNDYRRFYGLKPYASFEELVGDKEVAEALQSLYGDVDAVEFVVGVFVEKSGRSVVPPTLIHLVGPVMLREILRHPIGSASLWRSSTFGGKAGFEIVQKASLRKLFCANLRGNCRNNVWVSFRTPASATSSSRKIHSASNQSK